MTLQGSLCILENQDYSTAPVLGRGLQLAREAPSTVVGCADQQSHWCREPERAHFTLHSEAPVKLSRVVQVVQQVPEDARPRT